MHEIAFPGLGIDEFSVNTTAIDFGSIRIQWYAIFICIGILVAYFYAIWRGKHSEGFTEDDIVNLVLFLVPISIIGARLLYVTTADGFLSNMDSWTDIFKIWQGGLAIYGALIFGALTIIVYSRVTKLKMFKLLDCIAPAVQIGQVIGRWGNFVNGEAYGYSANVDKLPWRMVVDGNTVHPTFFYESLWNLIGFIVLNKVYKKKKYDGQIFAFYSIWYGAGRALIELLRTDSLLSSIKLMSWFGVASVILGIVIILTRHHSGRFEDVELAEYLAKRADGPSEETERTDQTISETTAEPETKAVKNEPGIQAEDDSTNDETE